MIILHNEISGTNKFHEIKIYHNLPEAESKPAAVPKIRG